MGEPKPTEPRSGFEMMEDSVDKAAKETVERHERQARGLRNAFEVAIAEYKRKFNELPKFESPSAVDQFVRARPDLWRAIQGLDTVLSAVQRVALEILEEMRDGSAATPGE